MALDALRCNHLAPLDFKGLNAWHHVRFINHNSYVNSIMYVHKGVCEAGRNGLRVLQKENRGKIPTIVFYIIVKISLKGDKRTEPAVNMQIVDCTSEMITNLLLRPTNSTVDAYVKDSNK